MQSIFVAFRRSVGCGRKLKVNNVVVRAEGGKKNPTLVSQSPPPPTLPLNKSPSRSSPQIGFSSMIKTPTAFFRDIQGIATGSNEVISFLNENKKLLRDCFVGFLMVVSGCAIVGLALWSKIFKVVEDILAFVDKRKDVGGTPFLSSSLYVGDIDFRVTNSQLRRVFTKMGRVVSVRVCRDKNTGRSLGYGYVNYSNITDAQRAMDMLNLAPMHGKPIRITYSRPYHKNNAKNIFIKNLDKSIDNKGLLDAFSTFGNILSCIVAIDLSGQSKGYGFVLFDNEESAISAIDKMNGKPMKGKQVYVGPYIRKHTRFNSVYVKNLSQSTTIDDLKKCFCEYGTITSCVVMRDANGKSKGFGFVNFKDPDNAARAVEALNGYKFDDEEWYVRKAQKKYRREMELKGQFEQTTDRFQELDLYVINLDDSITDDKLMELFSEFGTITLCKVMRDPNGISRGMGFVAFSIVEEASRALAQMNGKMVVSKPLFVARSANFQAQISQMLGCKPPYPLMLPRGRHRNIPFMDTGPLEPSALADGTFEECSSAAACFSVGE